MSIFNAVTDSMVRSDANGRRIFCYGPIFARKRCVYVDADQERRLRRTFGLGWIAILLVVVFSASWASVWVRLGIFLPTGVGLIHETLRRKTAGLPGAPAPKALSQRQVAINSAKAMGWPLLWAELVVLLALGGLAMSPAISYEDAGWYKYVTTVLGFGGAAYVAFQLYLLHRES